MSENIYGAVPEFTAAERQVLRDLLKSKTHSPKFWPRAFAVAGHHFAAVLAIYGVAMAVAVVIVGIAALVK